jgi:hypothetical protein
LYWLRAFNSGLKRKAKKKKKKKKNESKPQEAENGGKEGTWRTSGPN